ncbi:MAG: hypothetical protein FJY43_04950 [Betaproteobacteria bacterium]|nr:hypothetical protein [Betaproteobacteria bacterium]
MRRNDYDVTDSIRTTDAGQVRGEVLRVFRGLYDGKAPRAVPAAIKSAFDDVERAYSGEDAEYQPCDTEYHDIQHVLDITLAMARLLDGYERSRGAKRSRAGKSPHLPPEYFALGVITALYHDFGYLKRRSDRRHRYGAEYTMSHVTRGSKHLRAYLPGLGLRRLANVGATLVHFTGYERPAETIPINDTLLRRVGHMLGTADIIAQMSDRCYLEKCRDRLYPEFVLGGLAQKTLSGGRKQVLFRSGDDLVRKTPALYMSAAKRLDLQLARAYEYAERHFAGQNLYIEEMQKNVRYAQTVAQAPDTDMLRRAPPSTLNAGIEPYPKGMVIR